MEQNISLQLDALEQAGCARVITEQMSGTSKSNNL